MTNGFDGSMMNALQSLDQWEDCFNHPAGRTLGLLNAIQVSLALRRPNFELQVARSEDYRQSRRLSLYTLSFRRPRATANNLHRSHNYGCSCRNTNGGEVTRDVSRSSVSRS